MFTVSWTRSAESELANLWLSSDSQTRLQISAASAEIDRRLKRNPTGEGESREGSDRILFESPLAAYFRVYHADRLVVVVHVWAAS